MGHDGSRVRVTRRGRGRALVVDGTFASFWLPGQAVTGSVWDAIAAPLLALPPERRRSILLLGLGGGSAARLARALAPRARIVGVEIDRGVVAAARRHFGLDALRVEVVCADAREYLAAARERFDAVLDDVFVGCGRAVRKPDWLPEPGLVAASRRLRPRGVLVSNALDEAPRVARALQRLLPNVVQIGVAGYDNRITAASRRPLTARGLRRALVADPILSASAPRLRLRSVGEPGAVARLPWPATEPGGARRW